MYFSKFISILVTLDLLIPLTIRYMSSINIPLRVTLKSNPKFSSPILLLMALLHLPLKFLSALKSQVVWFMAMAFNKHIYFTFRGLRQWHTKWQHLKKIKLFFYIECVNGIRLIIPKLALIFVRRARCVGLITCLLFWLCCFGTWGTANMPTRLFSKATGL